MMVNLKIIVLNLFVTNMVMAIIFLLLKLPNKKGIVERKNRTLKEIARTMLCENNLSKYFWGEAINTACYVINRVSIRSLLSKTPYELYKGRKPNV